MGSTMGLLLSLERFVDEVLRGKKVGHRRTAEESMLDVIPADARDIVYGLAFQRWTGARLRMFMLLAGRRYHALFLSVVLRRIRALALLGHAESAFELEALKDLLNEFQENHPELKEKLGEINLIIESTNVTQVAPSTL